MNERRKAAASWTKSSYSAVNGDCLEVKTGADHVVRVRDSKVLRSPEVGFSAHTWAAFLRDLARTGG